MRSPSAASSSPSAVRTGPALTIASTPRCGREPWAARPVTSISAHTKPLWATTTSSSVGSVTTAASARTAASASCTPRLACSSSATAATTTSPARAAARGLPAGEQRGGDAGLHVVGAAAVQAVAVDARRVRRGHALDADGVEVRAQQQRAAAARAACADDARWGDRAWPRGRSVSRPASRAQPATKPAICDSPAPPGTSEGLTESMATSREVRSTTASRTARMVSGLRALEARTILGDEVGEERADAAEGGGHGRRVAPGRRLQHGGSR